MALAHVTTMLATPNFKSSTMVIALLQHNDNESNGQHW
jgi:hypothetical protein